MERKYTLSFTATTWLSRQTLDCQSHFFILYCSKYSQGVTDLQAVNNSKILKIGKSFSEIGITFTNIGEIGMDYPELQNTLTPGVSRILFKIGLFRFEQISWISTQHFLDFHYQNIKGRA